MNRKTPPAWIVAAVAACCVLLAFFLLTSVDPAGPPKTGNAKAAARMSFSGMPGETATTAGASTASAPAAVASGPSDLSHPAQQPQDDSLLVPVLPANNYTLDAATGSVMTAGGEHQLTGTEGLFDSVMIGETETAAIRLNLPNLKAGEEVVVSASNGGRLERVNGPLRFTAQESSARLDLRFTSTMGRGAYTIDVRHAGAVATVNLWAGPPLPVGEAGPDFIPLPPSTDTIP